MAAVKLHLNATYAQHLALKSVYEKKQCIMSGKLFSSSYFLLLVIFLILHNEMVWCRLDFESPLRFLINSTQKKRTKRYIKFFLVVF